MYPFILYTLQVALSMKLITTKVMLLLIGPFKTFILQP